MSHWAEHFVGKPYERGAQGPDAYNCWGLVRVVFRDRLGVDLPMVELHDPQREVLRLALKHFEPLPGPEDMAGVMMTLPDGRTHVGIWLGDEGRLLHCIEGDSGGVVTSLPQQLAMMGYGHREFYRCKA